MNVRDVIILRNPLVLMGVTNAFIISVIILGFTFAVIRGIK